ncbi:MAG TPA: sulfite exporter TauE/SafE family protein [Magnetospirillaceae bacterium]|jgi:hypothetical protein
MITNIDFYLVAVPATILWGLSKGGFAGLSALSLPLMALVMSPLRASSIILPILIVQDLVSVWAYRKTWDKRNLVILLPSAVIGIALGYLFAAQVSEAALELALGLIALTFAIRRFVLERKNKNRATTQAKILPGIVWGTISGFASMIANAGGPPFQVYVVPQRMQRDTFVGTGVVFFAVVNWLKVPPFIALGLFTRETVMTSLVMFPLAIASTWAGVLLVRRVSGERLYQIIYALLLLVGLKLIWSGGSALLGL